MKTLRTSAMAVLIGASGVALMPSAVQPGAELHGYDCTSTPAAADFRSAAPCELVTVVADAPIPNLPGKRLVSRVIEYPPGGRSVPHSHAQSAFIYAYVLSGRIRSRVNDEPARVYTAGEVWFERPGSHHPVSENASDTEPAKLLAVVVVDENDKQLTIPDKHPRSR